MIFLPCFPNSARASPSTEGLNACRADYAFPRFQGEG
jgi:hypothetical protein